MLEESTKRETIIQTTRRYIRANDEKKNCEYSSLVPQVTGGGGYVIACQGRGVYARFSTLTQTFGSSEHLTLTCEAVYNM